MEQIRMLNNTGLLKVRCSGDAIVGQRGTEPYQNIFALDQKKFSSTKKKVFFAVIILTFSIVQHHRYFIFLLVGFLVKFKQT